MKTVGEFLNASKDISNVVNNLKNGVITYKESFGLLSQAMSKYSLEAVKSTLIDSGLDKAQIRLILSSKGLKDKTLEEAVAQVMDAQAKKVNKEATEDLTEKELALKYAVGGLKDTIIKFATSTVGKLTIATTALALLGTKIYNLQKADEEALESSKEKLDELSSEYESVTSEVESLESQVSSLNNQIDELDPITDDAQIKKLKEERAELEQELAILKERQTYLNAETAKAAEDALKQTSSSQYSYDNYEQTSSMYTDDVGANAGLTIGHIIANQGVADQVTEYEELILAMEEVNKLEKERQELETQQGQYTNDTEKWNEYKEKIANVDDQIENVKTHASTLASSVQSSWSELADGEFKDEISEILFKYFEFSDAVDAATASFEALNVEQQKNILIGKLQEQSLDDNQIQSIMSNISEEDYTDLYSVDWSEVAKPNASDYDTYEEYGKAFAQAWLDGIVQGSTLDNEAGVSFSDVFNTDGISTVSEEIDKIQNAYQTLSSAIDEYNENGSFSIDTLQSVIALGDDWLDYLVDENGNLKLDNESLQQLTASRLNDMRVQTLNNLIDNVSKIQTDADANLYLASTNYELANSYEAVAQASLQSAKTQLDAAVDAGTLSAYNRDKAWSKLNADANKINKLFNNTSLGSISLGGGSSSSSSKSEFSELVDFFERRVKVLSNALELLDANLENVSGSFAKNKLVDGQLAINEEKIKNYSDALKMYTEGAEYALSKLPSDIAEKVKNGAVDVTYFVGEENEVIAETIDEYEKCAEKVSTYQDELAKLKETLRQLQLKKFNNIIEDFTNQFDIRSNSISLLEKQIALFEEAGELIGESFYLEQIEQSRKQLEILEEEKVKLAEQLTSALTSGNIQQGTDEWLEMVNALSDLDGQILECKTSIEELDNSLLDLDDQVFERVQEQFSNLNDELEHLIGLFDDFDVATTDGNWTKEGIAQLGLLTQQFELARHQVEEYSKEIDDLNANYLNGRYSATEYAEKLAELTEQQWEAVESSESIKDAIVELNESRINIQIEGIEDEIDAFKELTNAQIEALEASKDLHDYQEDIADKTKDVTDLEKQIAALSLDTSASGIAKRKKLEEELAEAKKALADAEYEHSIEVQKEALTEQYENFESEKNDEIEVLKESLEDQESIIAQSFETVKQNANTVGQEIANIAQKHGVTVSTTLTTSWQQGENAIASYGETLSVQSSAFIDNLVSVENEVYTLQEKADETSVSIANIFSNKADSLVSELITSYNSLENVTAMSNALKDSLVSTLESGYDTSGIISSINSIIEAANSLSGSIQNLGETFNDFADTEYSTSVTVSRKQISTTKNVVTGTNTKQLSQVSKYASGTRSTKGEVIVKNEEGFELTFPKLSSGNYALAPEGSQILTKAQTDNLFDWAKFNPDVMIPWSVSSGLNTVPKIPQVVNRNENRPVNVNSTITFTGAVNDANNFAKDIAKIADRQITKSWKEFNDSLKY